MRLNLSLVLALFAWLAAAPPAAARTLQDCEAIKDWHAYNLCLSSFGPRRGQASQTVAGRQGEGAAEARVYGRKVQRAASARRGPRGLAVQRVGSGRVRATFIVGGASRSPAR